MQRHLSVYDVGNEFCYPKGGRNALKWVKHSATSFYDPQGSKSEGNSRDECGLHFLWHEVEWLRKGTGEVTYPRQKDGNKDSMVADGGRP